METPEKLVILRSVPVDSFGNTPEQVFAPQGEYRPLLSAVGDGEGDWWIFSMDCHPFLVGLPVVEWQILAKKGFLQII